MLVQTQACCLRVVIFTMVNMKLKVINKILKSNYQGATRENKKGLMWMNLPVLPSSEQFVAFLNLFD